MYGQGPTHYGVHQHSSPHQHAPPQQQQWHGQAAQQQQYNQGNHQTEQPQWLAPAPPQPHGMMHPGSQPNQQQQYHTQPPPLQQQQQQQQQQPQKQQQQCQLNIPVWLQEEPQQHGNSPMQQLHHQRSTQYFSPKYSSQPQQQYQQQTPPPPPQQPLQQQRQQQPQQQQQQQQQPQQPLQPQPQSQAGIGDMLQHYQQHHQQPPASQPQPQSFNMWPVWKQQQQQQGIQHPPPQQQRQQQPQTPGQQQPQPQQQAQRFLTGNTPAGTPHGHHAAMQGQPTQQAGASVAAQRSEYNQQYPPPQPFSSGQPGSTGLPPGVVQYSTSRQYGAVPGAPQQQQAAPHAAGAYRPPIHIDIPGRGAYGGGGDSQGTPLVSPARFAVPGNGWETNVDAVHTDQAGLSCAHNFRDGMPKFQGTYSQAHAGKTSQSSFNKDYSIAKGPYLDEAVPHTRKQGVGPPPLPGLALGDGDPAGAMPAGRPGVHVGQPGAPWQKDHGLSNNVGVRMLPGAPQNMAHVFNTPSGLAGPEEPLRGRQQQGRATQSNMVMSKQGLSHMDDSGEKMLLPATKSHFAAHSNASNLVQGPQGLVEKGQSDYKPGPYAGVIGLSTLQADSQGMHGPAKVFQPMARHAGKATASHMVHGNGGITVMGKMMPPGLPAAAGTAAATAAAAGGAGGAGGQGHWSTTYDDTYHHLQVGQLQMKQNMQERNKGPDRF